VVLGTVVGLFGLLFVLFLLLEYALVPLIRALAG
jgi:cytochrome c oxidase assembly protein Cox11